MKNNQSYILIADDEKEIRDILKLLLEGEGYEVLVVADGKAVLEAASPEIDLYILDVNMPEMTGFVAAMELRKTTDAPIIFLTAYSGEMDKVMGFSAGADDYVVKPFSNMELLMRVKAILRRRVGNVEGVSIPKSVVDASVVSDRNDRGVETKQEGSNLGLNDWVALGGNIFCFLSHIKNFPFVKEAEPTLKYLLLRTPS